MAALLAFMGGLLQINPIWSYGPFDATTVSAPSQPDWYIGWLEGALRLFPPWEFAIFGVTFPSTLIPGVVMPGIAFGVMGMWPFIERRITGDKAEHHLLDRPRDAAIRTAVGAAGLVFFTVLTLAGGNDVLALTFDVSVSAITWFFRIGLIVLPVLAGLLTHRICNELQRHEGHPFGATKGVVLKRTPDGGFEEEEM